MSDDSKYREFLRCRRGKVEIDYTCGKPIAMRFKTISKSRRVKIVTRYFIRDIVQWRRVLQGGSVIRHEYKVAWEGFDPEDDVWMREERLLQDGCRNKMQAAKAKPSLQAADHVV